MSGRRGSEEPAASTISTTSSTSTANGSTTTPSAPLAVTVASFAVAGWWDGQGWVAADGQRPVPLSGGEDFSILSVTGPAKAGKGSAPEEGCETDPGTSKVTVSGLQAGQDRPGPVAVHGVVAPRPRPTEVLDPNAATYKEAARAFLADRGIDDPDPPLAQVLRADLEGDGGDEVVLVVERIADRNLYAQAGDYSFVLLRRVVDEAVRTTVVAESVPHPGPGETPFILSHRVASIGDLNGDGRMEVALELAQYEGVGLSVHELQADGSLPAVMAVDCGA